MWPFKKTSTIVKPKDELPPLTFSQEDSSYQRAYNIWYAIGFANDRNNMIAKIAGYLELYKAFDEGVSPPERPDLYYSKEEE